METEKYYFRVGLFFAVVSAAFVYYLIVFGGGQESRSLMRYAITFDHSVAGLTRGAPVKLKGIEVGLVDSIRFVSRDNDEIRVLADIDETAPVNGDTLASVAFQGITGTTYLALENDAKPGAKPAPLVKKEGEKYPVIRSGPSELQTALSSAPAMISKLGKTADQAQRLLSDNNIAAVQGLLPEAHDALREAAGAFREFKMLARTLREDPSIILRGTKYDGYKVQQ